MRTTKLNHPCFCPVCFALIDAATDLVGTASPKSGDLTLCIDCGSALMFDSLLMLYPALESELIAYGKRDPETFDRLGTVQQAVLERLRTRRWKHPVKELVQ